MYRTKGKAKEDFPVCHSTIQIMLASQTTPEALTTATFHVRHEYIQARRFLSRILNLVFVIGRYGRGGTFE